MADVRDLDAARASIDRLHRAATDTERDDDLVDAREAMDRLNLSRSAFYRIVQSGELRSVRVGPRSTRFRIGDLRAFIEANRTPPVRNDGLPKRSRSRLPDPPTHVREVRRRD
jgi:excisionase family DNA binding protein